MQNIYPYTLFIILINSIFVLKPNYKEMNSFITFEKDIRAKLDDCNGRLSAERLFIIEYIYVKRLSNIDPDALYMDIRQHKKITLATVYSTLKLLCKFGYIEIVPKRYKVKLWE